MRRRVVLVIGVVPCLVLAKDEHFDVRRAAEEALKKVGGDP
jgi:hypothetical protein